MAAHQNVKLKSNPKKTKYSKKVATAKEIVEEGSASSGKKSNLDSESSVKNYESRTICDSLSPTGLNKKKIKERNIERDTVLFNNVKELEKSNENSAVSCHFNESKLHIPCILKDTGIELTTGSEGLSKSKKRRLRKRKLKLASVAQFSIKSLVNSETNTNFEPPLNIRNENKVSELTRVACSNTEDQGCIEIKKNSKNPIQYYVPSENNENVIVKNYTTLNNFPEYSPNTLTADLAESCDSNSKVCSSLNEKTHSDITKYKIEEQNVTAQNFNDVFLNVMKTFNSNDEILPKSCSSYDSSETEKQNSLKVKNGTLESDLNLIGKIKDFSETFSKLECVEKLLSNSALDQVSGENVDGSISKYKTRIKDLTSSLPVDDSYGVLQVDDKSDTVAGKNCIKKEGSCDTLHLVTTKMDAINDNVDKSTSAIKKSREEILAEREAKKAAKLAAKKGKPSAVKSLPNKVNDVVDGCIDVKKPSLPVVDSIHKEEEKSKLENPLTISTHLVDLKKNQDPQIIVSKKIESVGKTKAELRAERREKQEAQRAAKASQKEPVKQPQKNDSVIEQKTEKDVDGVKEIKKSLTAELIVKSKYKVKLFSHLYFEKETFQNYDCCNIHPAILQLGAQYETRVISGSNARCLALLHTLKRMISDFSTPSKQEFSRGLESMLAKSMDYLNHCRPSSVSMTNAVRHIKRHLTQLPNTIPDSEARQKLYDVIETYIREQIDVAGEAICNTVQKKINNGDVILTYGCSSLIYRILLESHKSGTKFSVVIVDAGPWFEGREMLRRLVREGVKCTYILITAASFIMREASKVLLGAHALLANGYVMSRAGTSQVALLAHSYNVPILVCCETHKFSERVQTDAFVYNELGDPDEFVSKNTGPLSHWRSYDYLTPLSIAFDVTPPDLVTAVVTELGILPCTSVPVILRIKPSETV